MLEFTTSTGHPLMIVASEIEGLREGMPFEEACSALYMRSGYVHFIKDADRSAKMKILRVLTNYPYH